MKYDVIVVGAGIVGLSSAYYIKKYNPDLNLAVVERASTYGQGNTGKSAAGFRDVFTSDINFKLSNSTVAYYRSIQDSGTDIGMKFCGYLFLLRDKDPREDHFDEIGKKTSVRIIDLEEIRGINYLNPAPDRESAELMSLPTIMSAVLGENCGIIEPDLICKHYFDECVKMGVQFFFNFEVESLSLDPVNKLDFPGEPFLWQDKILRSLKSGKREMQADGFVIATDVWTTSLLDPTGIDSHIRPKKRQVFQVGGENIEKMVFDDRFTGSGICPFTILPKSGIYLRPAPRERAFWVGVADDIQRDFSLVEDPQAENAFYEMNLLQVIRSYYQSFSSAKLQSSWAGYYSYNTIDKVPYVFRSLNMIIATGTSGSGILKGDGIGRSVEAAYSRKGKVKLSNGLEFDTEDLGIRDRRVDPEKIIL